MKIVIEISPTTSISTMRGWSHAFTSLGHSVVFYDSKSTPIFDIFDEYYPDIFISTVNDISRGIAKVLLENPSVITLFYSPIFDQISGENISYVRELKEEVGKPDFIFTFGELNSINEWTINSFKTISVPKAADNVFYAPLPYQATWSSDIAFVGNYSSSLDKYIIPLCNQSDWSFRIFGGGLWPVSNYVGNVQPENLKHIYSSAKVVLDLVSEGTDGSDIPYNVIACGGICLSNFHYNTFPANVVLNFDDINQMVSLINKVVSGRLTKSNFKITEEFTYINRIKTLLQTVGLEDEIHEID